MSQLQYIGRFAPSPTGQLHFGTLTAAVASFLQAKTQQGLWLIRMEDVDTLRTVKNADTELLTTLDNLGFEWDGEIVYQSNRTKIYNEVLEQLKQQNAVFPCTCSRKNLDESQSFKSNGVYPGLCRDRDFPINEEHSIRLRTTNIEIKFDDIVMGSQQENIQKDCGDFVIKRRDGLFAYQLAVVVDDALQGITEIVRGADLLNSTARQIYLQQSLGYTTPNYMHLPLVLDDDGNKLSKSNDAKPVDKKNAASALFDSLIHLGQKPPNELRKSNIDDIWSWALQNWDIVKIPQSDKKIT